MRTRPFVLHHRASEPGLPRLFSVSYPAVKRPRYLIAAVLTGAALLRNPFFSISFGKQDNCERGQGKGPDGQKLYIHNDLSQAATHFHDVIQEKLKNGNRDGIAFDGMGCALMVAFAFEANLNFMGCYLLKTGKITSSDEFSKHAKKLKKVFDALGIKIETDQRPLSSMERVKALRDTFAHGKPVEIKTDELKEGSLEELRKGSGLAAAWEKEIKPVVVAEALSDLDDLWKLMVQKSGIDVMDTFSNAETGIIVVPKAS